ncbi:stage II sporulation protein M [Natronosalvus halobius]|uniref:stage II sporulation protein M n=1 Tax=Natronosalvus halobius TaxID=2953746 RepID=UPI0020A01E1D|nr:stage II sporulation protein M [Natronosalvus halobius]USZ70694.1 stage II sporulation protein M [Natronosalvus halobius]
MATRSRPATDSRDGPLVLVLALAVLTLLTALYLLVTESSIRPAVGASLLAFGFAAFAAVDQLSERRVLVALEAGWREHRPYVGFAAATFAIGILLGVLLYALGVDLLEFVLEALGEEFVGDEELEPGAGSGSGSPSIELTAGLFVVNNSGPFALAILGAVSLGAFTLLIMVFNGILIGNLAVGIGGQMGYAEFVTLLVPHGVFELTALFIAAGIGFRLVHRFGQRLRGSRDSFLTKRYLYRTGLLACFGWFLLVLAAFVEAYLTIAIAETLFEI